MLFGVVGNIEKKELKSLLVKLFEYFDSNKIDFLFDERFLEFFNISEGLSGKSCPSDKVIQNCDIVFALGGDGTILKIARETGDLQKPILGVNLGKLGFLAETGRDELFDFINDIRNNKYKIEERIVIEAEIKNYECNKFFGLNDIVVEKSQTSRVVSIEAYVNNEYVITLMADGLIVSTPTGSTAYSLAANGPIVVPSCNVIIINPICPHTLTARSIIIPDNYELKALVNCDCGQVLITADGQVEEKLKTPLEINFKKAGYKVKLVKRLDRSYYDLLRLKLMWGKDMRIEKIN